MNEHLKKLLNLDLNFKQGEKVKISPIGEVIGFDGRTFRIDGEAVITETKQNGIDLVCDVNHGWSEEKEAAAGWFDINSLELREDGIYAALTLTEIGTPLVAKKLYKYLSPAYIMDRNKEDRTVLSIDSVALVNRPNLIADALNSKQNGEHEKQVKELNSKIETLETEKNQAAQTIEKTGKELQETNSKLEASQDEVKECNSKIKDLTIALAVEQNKILPKDVEFCKKLDETQLSEYLENNAGGTLAQSLGGELKAKENNNTKSIVEAAVKAGSKK